MMGKANVRRFCAPGPNFPCFWFLLSFPYACKRHCQHLVCISVTYRAEDLANKGVLHNNRVLSETFTSTCLLVRSRPDKIAQSMYIVFIRKALIGMRLQRLWAWWLANTPQLLPLFRLAEEHHDKALCKLCSRPHNIYGFVEDYHPTHRATTRTGLSK
jgi:hypothetical protein